MPRISIVIPTHNNPDTLPRTIDSIRAQTFTDFEVIIVNDGGQSPSEFLDLGDERFRLVDLPRNQGVSNARNVGFEESSGDLVYFLDADDFIAEDLLSMASEKMMDSRWGMFAVLHKPVPVDRVHEEKELLKAKDRVSGFREMDPAAFCDAFRQNTQNFLPSTVLFRRSAILETGGEKPWETSMKNGADTLIIMLVGARYEVLQSLDTLVMYSVRPNSLSRQSALATWNARIVAMDHFLDRMTAEGADKRVIEAGRRLRQNGARRASRIYKANRNRAQGARVLLEDLRKHPNGKSFLELIRLAVLPG